ncbi:2-C-methyl-D-erythritol 4-phosphate cytidylyltransferase [Desulfovibrio sp. X2]|uniref:2-C-methyl-D-erythritol 4-phosphate cytidylyltransferase n=1 Tax=Desulfovibrio sp. X2 TaxID=941449 RepID=UPI0003587B77|nr:2-C-methyl-D-erythritol 4-phosphate cytidylyltransferase [Desulfovibrio sp. X2]EPR37561.1 2-C-methyl-D-erythritol 4-phosphate cytidylyltransferase [Desulfovibrio sp. X2]
MSLWSIILAAGSGSRLAAAGLSVRKQFLHYRGAPLFWHSARTLSRLPELSGIVLVFPAEALDESEDMLRDLASREPLDVPLRAVAGGARRQDSVAAGLAALPRDARAVLVHDAARPFLSVALAARLADALSDGARAAIPGLAVTDTIKIVTPDGTVADTPERAFLRAVQTPQAFDLALLRSAHTRAEAEGWDVTDDAMLVERLGEPVLVIEGEPGNVKITTPEDLLLLAPRPGESGEFAPQEDPRMRTTEHPTPETDGAAAEAKGRARMPVRQAVTGFGYDVHKFGPGRPFVLGTVPFPGAPEIVAHSDGDVLLHALMDAILGCMGKGDIGKLFPDSDASFDNASSAVLLDEVLELARSKGYELVHADLTVISQIPKVGPHRERIQEAVARLLGLPPERVGIKATTEEGLGFTGEKKGIKCVAVVTALLPAR